MQVSSRTWKIAGSILAVGTVAAAGVWAWVIPAVIVGQIQSRVEGKVTIRNWWLGGTSAGVVGVTLHDGPSADSPVFATIDRVATDLSLSGLIRGRFVPARLALERPRLTFRLARDGRIANLPRVKSPGGSGPATVPTITVANGRVSFERAGNAGGMVIQGVGGRLEPVRSATALHLSARADDPDWGRWNANGTIDTAAGGGRVRLAAERVDAEPRRLADIPFIPSEVWSHIQPTGPVDVAVNLAWSAGGTPALTTHTALVLRQTRAQFPTLGLEAGAMTGQVVVDGALVHLQNVRGESIGGTLAADGTMDFAHAPSRIDLDLRLNKIDVAQTPRTWKLDESGITGLLTGRVQLRATLAASGVDMSGSSGDAVVEKATIQGIPVKSLRLAMHAHGRSLEYDTKTPAESSARLNLRFLVASLPWFHAGADHRARLLWDTIAAEDLVAFQASPAKPSESMGSVRLPQSITTQMELDDVDLATLIAKAQFMSGFPLPIPITGRLTLKATATIPLGAIRDVKRYAFHGDATLRNASVYKVDIQRITARLDLADGRLELKDLRGALADRPDGGPDNPPPGPAPDVPEHGPLPAGAFRGNLQARLAPLGKLAARFEGNALPVGELSAPVLPRPTPLAGLASMQFDVAGDLGAANDPAAWTVSGKAESVQITYHGAVLDKVLLNFALKEGHLDVPDLAAQLGGRPLTARGGVDLKPPYAFRGKVDVAGWNIAQVVALVPSAPQPSPVSGTVTASAEAEGTASPLAVETRGQGQLDRLVAGPVGLGDVPFRWTTDHRVVAIAIPDAHPFGGRLTANVEVPVGADRPTKGSARFAGIDTAAITAAIPGDGLKLTGKADGTLTFTVPAHSRAVEADVRLSAPDLAVQGVPAEHVRASLRAHQGSLKYELTAESLGGTFKFLGDLPLTRASPANAATGNFAEGELKVAGFSLHEIWKALNVSGLASHLTGTAAIDANVRDFLSGSSKGLWARGYVELQDLRWAGTTHPGGHLRGVVTRTPTTWRLEPLSGELLGGAASGVVWGATPPQGQSHMGFNLQVDRAALPRLVQFVPALARNLQGVGSLKMTGSMTSSFHSELSFHVEQGRIAGVPINGLRIPAEVAYTPALGTGVLNLRHGSARLAGGQVQSDASIRFGQDRSFQAQVQLSGLDLQTLSRLESDSNRPPTGRVSGRIAVSGADVSRPERYRGRFNLELEDASLVSVPVFREIDRFLGAARGGLFEQGDVEGSIARSEFLVDALTLEGRLVQLHATGTVGFDSQVNLEVLINTNQLIPETGQALVGRIPGLREVLGRSDQAAQRVGTYLSNRLLKLRVTGSLKNPSVSLDPSVNVAGTAVEFFAGVLKLPLGFIR